MIHHTANGREFLLVQVPEGAVAFSEGYGYLTYKVTDPKRMITDAQLISVALTGELPKTRSKHTDMHGEWPVMPGMPIKLPPGTWKIHGIAAQLTEEQAGGGWWGPGYTLLMEALHTWSMRSRTTSCVRMRLTPFPPSAAFTESRLKMRCSWQVPRPLPQTR